MFEESDSDDKAWLPVRQHLCLVNVYNCTPSIRLKYRMYPIHSYLTSPIQFPNFEEKVHSTDILRATEAWPNDHRGCEMSFGTSTVSNILLGLYICLPRMDHCICQAVRAPA